MKQLQRLQTGSRIFADEDEEPELSSKTVRKNSTDSLLASSTTEGDGSPTSRCDSKSSIKMQGRQVDAFSEASTSMSTSTGTGSDVTVRDVIRPRVVRRSSTDHGHCLEMEAASAAASANLRWASERPQQADGLTPTGPLRSPNPLGPGRIRRTSSLSLCDLEMLGHEPVLEPAELPPLPQLRMLSSREKESTSVLGGYGGGNLAPTIHPQGRRVASKDSDRVASKDSKLPALK